MKQASIEVLLTSLGEDIIFAGFPSYTIKAFLGFNTNFMQNNEAATSIERREYASYISTKQSVEFNIEKGNRFTISDGVFKYLFEIQNNPVPDLSGFSKINLTYIDKAYV